MIEMPVVICARRTDPEGWADVDLAIRSALHYSPSPIHVYWSDGTDNTLAPLDAADYDSRRLTIRRQPDEATTFGAAYEYGVAETLRDHPEADGVIIANDDIVLRPDSYQLLVDDVAALAAHGYRPGLVASRANYIRPSQQSVGPAAKIVNANAVSPVFAWIAADALRTVEWPHTNWYSDDILCHDIQANGFGVYVSRSYVHHIGERSTTEGGTTRADLDSDGRRWLVEHRPDVASALGVTHGLCNDNAVG